MSKTERGPSIDSKYTTLVSDEEGRKRRTHLAVIECGLSLDSKITVCAECIEASCWLGEFMCEGSRNAGVIQKTVEELIRETGEHPSYWKKVLTAEGGE